MFHCSRLYTGSDIQEQQNKSSINNIQNLLCNGQKTRNRAKAIDY